MASVENKIFVGGLAAYTTKDSMAAHFSQFGVVDCQVMMDSSTGRSRGFGFCIFPSREAVDMVLAGTQVLDGKPVDCKICLPKEHAPPPQQARSFGGAGGGAAPAWSPREADTGRDFQQQAPAATGGGELISNKIFVGGLPAVTTSETMQAYFGQYGFCDCIVMMDKQTGRSRGFGFCTFESVDEAQSVLATPLQHIVDGKTVECKMCEPKGPSHGASGGAWGGGGGEGQGKGAWQGSFRAAPVAKTVPPAQLSLPALPGPSQSAYATAAPSAPQDDSRIFVGGLPQNCDDAALQEFAEQFGAVTEVRVMMDSATGRSRGFGYVSFAAPQSVETALAYSDQNIIGDKWVEVKRCTPKGSSAPAYAAPTYATSAAPAYAAPPPQPSAASKSPQTIAEQANQLASLLQDPNLGLSKFLAPMLDQLQKAADAAKTNPSGGSSKGGGKGAGSPRYVPY